MSKSSEKMFEIAKYLGELNKDGKVKGFKGNGKGHAKIKEFCRGCSIWVHHEKTDELIIDLMVSDSSKNNYHSICNQTVKKFKDFFDSNFQDKKWNHSIDKTDYDRYIIGVSDYELAEIFLLIEKVKKYF